MEALRMCVRLCKINKLFPKEINPEGHEKRVHDKNLSFIFKENTDIHGKITCS